MNPVVYSLPSHTAVALLFLVAMVAFCLGLFIGRAAGKALGYERGRADGLHEGVFTRRELEALRRNDKGEFRRLEAIR